jgi:hypothetical protein
VFLDINGIENGQVVVPVQLKYVKGEDGKFGKPMVDVRQPQYEVKSGKNKGKWLTSYLSVHLNGSAAKMIEKLCGADWLKPAVARIQKSKVAADYELDNGSWKHVGDRELTHTDSPEDEQLLQNAIGAADEYAAKAEANAAVVEDAMMGGGTTADDDVAEKILGL